MKASMGKGVREAMDVNPRLLTDSVIKNFHKERFSIQIGNKILSLKKVKIKF